VKLIYRRSTGEAVGAGEGIPDQQPGDLAAAEAPKEFAADPHRFFEWKWDDSQKKVVKLTGKALQMATDAANKRKRWALSDVIGLLDKVVRGGKLDDAEMAAWQTFVNKVKEQG
jgi:hypothetical protein